MQQFVYVTQANDTWKGMHELFSKLELPSTADSICVKLNLRQYRRWETGATSDPAVVDSLLNALRSRYPDARLFLIENDQTGVNADNIFGYLGIDLVARKYNCETLNVRHCKWTAYEINGLHFKQIEIPDVITDADLFITHPKLKTHGKTKLSCGLKNQFGLLRQKNKISLHHYLDEAIVDSNVAMKPHLTIVDANLCHEGNGGPAFGRPKRLGLFIGGSDIVAVDSFCCRIAGFSPRSVRHVRKSEEVGLGKTSYMLSSGESLTPPNSYRLGFNSMLYHIMKPVRNSLQR